MNDLDNRALFETIFQQSPVSTQVFSPNGDTIMVNTAWEELWKIPFKKLSGYNILDDKQLVETGVMKYIKLGFKGETVTIPANKYDASKTVKIKGVSSYRWVQAIMYSIKDTKGKIKYIVLQHEDITERKDFEDSLKESRELFKATWEAAADAMVLSDSEGIVLEANKAYCNLYGYRPEDMIGKHFAMIFPVNNRKGPTNEYNRIFLEHKKPGNTVVAIVTRDGTKRIVESTYSFIEQDKKRIAMLSVIRDITEQKRSESALILSEERHRLAVEAGKIGVWDWDIINGELIWSDRIYEIYGANPKKFDVNLKEFVKLIHPEDKKITELAIKQALDGTKPYNITYRILTLSGEIRWIKTSATVQRDDKGKPIRMLGATSDVTEQKRLEEDKNDFISIATHELKTPVTSLKAYAETLQRKFTKNNDNFSATQLGKMNAQLDKLTSLISDLLDTTKIDSGKLQMTKEKFNFDELVQEVVEELQRTTERHTLIIRNKTQKDVQADRERMGQVLTNLISNAIKYSPHTDKIIIKTSATANQVQVCIQDFGVGIPKIKQSKLFQRFYRVSGPHDNTFPGLGLGLYISSEIIKRLGGKIWVDSTLGKGSTFCFILPLNAKIISTKNSLAEDEIRHE
jgi:PAS domain S-box-containing protein